MAKIKSSLSCIVLMFSCFVQAKQSLNVLDQELTVYRHRSPKSKVIGTLSEGELVPLLKTKAKKFYLVEMGDGKKGYVLKADIVSSVIINDKNNSDDSPHEFAVSVLGNFSVQNEREVQTSGGSDYTVDMSTSTSVYPELNYSYRLPTVTWKLGLLYKTLSFEQTARNNDSSGSLSETVTQVNQSFAGGQLSVGIRRGNFSYFLGGELLKALSSEIKTIKGIAIEDNDNSKPLFIGGLGQMEYAVSSHFLTVLKVGAVFNTSPFIFNVDLGVSYKF